jgi:hypothetical protein
MERLWPPQSAPFATRPHTAPEDPGITHQLSRFRYLGLSQPGNPFEPDGREHFQRDSAGRRPDAYGFAAGERLSFWVDNDSGEGSPLTCKIALLLANALTSSSFGQTGWGRSPFNPNLKRVGRDGKVGSSMDTTWESRRHRRRFTSAVTPSES